MYVHVEGGDLVCVVAIGHVRRGAAISTRGDGGGAYHSSTSAARCSRTTFWLIEPLSVISRASSDGGRSSTSARATNVELPVLSRARALNASWNLPATAGCARTSAAGASAGSPATSRHEIGRAHV